MTFAAGTIETDPSSGLGGSEEVNLAEVINLDAERRAQAATASLHAAIRAAFYLPESSQIGKLELVQPYHFENGEKVPSTQLLRMELNTGASEASVRFAAVGSASGRLVVLETGVVMDCFPKKSDQNQNS